MSIDFHSHLVKIFLKINLNRKWTLSPSLFCFVLSISKKDKKAERGK